jgi:alkylation response protein AidB-like acyl-CoA dehydrogenase
MASPQRDAAALVRAAKDFAPQIQRHRQEIERKRTLPAELVSDMTTAGFFSLWLARAFEGPELDFIGFARVVEELSRADGSVGWCAMVAAVYSRLSGFFTQDVGLEIFQNGASRLAGTINPTGKAVAVPGGFLVTGRWGYGSFVEHSHWTIGNSIVHDGETPRSQSNGAPDIRFMIIPTEKVEVLDNWRVAGLRGTGSHDFQVRDVFVPDEHSVSAFGAKPVYPGALYSVPLITLFAAAVPCVSLGIARAAIDAFVALAEAKTPMGSAVKLKDKPAAQIDLARAEALVCSARAFLFGSVEEVWAEVDSDKIPSLRQRALVRIAAAKAAEASVQAVDLLFNAAGGTALFESCPLERCFRDVHATTQHIATNAGNYEIAGRVMMGLDPGTPRF